MGNQLCHLHRHQSFLPKGKWNFAWWCWWSMTRIWYCFLLQCKWEKPLVRKAFYDKSILHGHIIFDICKLESTDSTLSTTSLWKSTLCSTNRITPWRVRLLRGSVELIWRGGRERERRSTRCGRPPARPPLWQTNGRWRAGEHRAHGKSSSLSCKDDWLGTALIQTFCHGHFLSVANIYKNTYAP